jgi:cell division protein FtsI (penicillin-binding protein 3)
VPAGVEPRQARWIAIRIGVVAVLLAAGCAAVSARAVKLQILQRDQMVRHGDGQWQRLVELQPRRGAITDRNGETLAASADAPSVAASPAKLARLTRAEQARLSRALGLEAGVLATKAQRQAHFVWLKRHVPPSEAKAVKDLGLDGVDLFNEPRRYYPSKGLAGQLVGLVGDDGEGLEGIELAFDDDLQGGKIRLPSVRDAKGRAVLDEAPAPESALL